MTAGREGSAVTRPDVAPVFAPEGVAVEATPGRMVPPPTVLAIDERLRSYDPKADTAVIDAAYSLAAKAHGTQTRDNGEPYTTNPVAVAGILAGYRLAPAPIVT